MSGGKDVDVPHESVSFFHKNIMDSYRQQQQQSLQNAEKGSAGISAHASDRAHHLHDRVRHLHIEAADHYSLVDASSLAWKEIIDAAEDIIGNI